MVFRRPQTHYIFIYLYISIYPISRMDLVLCDLIRGGRDYKRKTVSREVSIASHIAGLLVIHVPLLERSWAPSTQQMQYPIAGFFSPLVGRAYDC